MIERWIGPETFQKGIQQYLAAHEHGNATYADLVADLTVAAGAAARER
jgi:aminopeptidase N